ncbi:MAG: hypothetical protein JWR37_5507 [Mycobacterium sp.]|jgi:hypothetical protein|nr:hypothetical protein [Mycobacterium sp.]
MTERTDNSQQIIDDVAAVFVRLNDDVTDHLDRSWHGDGARNALDTLRGYISQSLDELDRYRSLGAQLTELQGVAGDLRTAVAGFDHDQAPGVSPGNAVAGAVVPTPMAVPAPFAELATPTVTPDGGGPPTAYGTSSVPTVRPAGFDMPDTPAAPSAPPPSSALSGGLRGGENPLPAASLTPATSTSTTQASAPTPPPTPGPPRAGMPFAPLMGAAYPGAMAREDNGGHRTPGYLITIDNGNELIGPLPKVAPPVLGDWPNIDPKSDSW